MDPVIAVGREDRLVNDEQADLFGWLEPRIQLLRTPDFRAVGRIVDGKIVGAFAFNNHNGASCQMHVAGEGRWLNRALLWKAFQVPFVEWRYNVLIGPISSANQVSQRLATGLGFSLHATIQDAHVDGALQLYVLRKEACKWLGVRYRDSHGR